MVETQNRIFITIGPNIRFTIRVEAQIWMPFMTGPLTWIPIMVGAHAWIHIMVEDQIRILINI